MSETTEGAAPAEPAQAEADTVSWDDLGMSPAEAKQAIAESQKWERRSKDNFAKLKEAEPKLAEYEQLRKANQTAEQRQAEELTRWQGEAEQWRSAAVGSRIQAIAATDFADPSDAVTALSQGSYLDAGGQIDDARIRADLAELLERKPHWRRTEQAPNTPRTPAPNRAQGTSATAAPGDPAAQFASIMQGHLRS